MKTTPKIGKVTYINLVNDIIEMMVISQFRKIIRTDTKTVRGGAGFNTPGVRLPNLEADDKAASATFISPKAPNQQRRRKPPLSLLNGAAITLLIILLRNNATKAPLCSRRHQALADGNRQRRGQISGPLPCPHRHTPNSTSNGRARFQSGDKGRETKGKGSDLIARPKRHPRGRATVRTLRPGLRRPPTVRAQAASTVPTITMNRSGRCNFFRVLTSVLTDDLFAIVI